MRCPISRSISSREVVSSMVGYTQAVVSYTMVSMMGSVVGSMMRGVVGSVD